jgi:hypothetical protein
LHLNGEKKHKPEIMNAFGKALKSNTEEEDWEIQSLPSCSGHSLLNRSSAAETNHDGGIENGHDGAKELRETVIKTEESAVNKSRILVGLAILLCAIAVTVAVYLIAKGSDQDSFELEVRI